MYRRSVHHVWIVWRLKILLRSLRVPKPVICDRLGRSSLAVAGRDLRDIAPAEVITSMRQRQWTEPSFSQANPARVDFTGCA